MKKYKVYCNDCKQWFDATDEHHNLDYCPVCDTNAVDIESYCTRTIGNIGEIKEQ